MRNLYCSLYGHDFKVTKNVTLHVKEYMCNQCKEKFTTSPAGHITSLTPKRQEINDLLESIYLKKLKRKSIALDY